ncbi:MAG: hypothetical protein KDE47_20725, partial [Caldilineaceae bacterium]|nr:hypothetical protein [Caldilineaceae bacterium]
MKDLLYTLAAIPALALIGGMGILAWRIGETWTSTTTQSLIIALTVICGGGALLFAILLALIVGIPLAIRAYGEGGTSHRRWAWDGDSGSGWGKAKRSQPPIDEWSAATPSKPRLPLIEGQWTHLPSSPTAITPASSTPPSWGISGGGHTH